MALILAPARGSPTNLPRDEALRFCIRFEVYGRLRRRAGRAANRGFEARRRGCRSHRPGRLIDILTMQQGRLIALSRVSFVVLDEADRMFDMGCEAVWKLHALACIARRSCPSLSREDANNSQSLRSRTASNVGIASMASTRPKTPHSRVDVHAGSSRRSPWC